MSKKTQLTYSVIEDEEYGYKRTHIRICERPVIDLVERLQRTLQNGPDNFSGETQEKKEKAFEHTKAELLELLKEGYSCYYDWNWDRSGIDITMTFTHYTHNGVEDYGNPMFERAGGFEHLKSMKRSIQLLEKMARASHKRQYEWTADKGDMCLPQINHPRKVVDCLLRAKAICVGRYNGQNVDRIVQVPEDITFLGDDQEEEMAA
jgi:hypothetical protein